MTAAALVSELRRLGVELKARGDRVLYRPQGSVPARLLGALQMRRDEVLVLLRQRDSFEEPKLAATSALDDGDLLDVRRDLLGVRLHSRLLDRELWLARDERAAAKLTAEFPRMPVLTFAEVRHLEGKPTELLQAILDTKTVFPDARLRQ